MSEILTEQPAVTPDVTPEAPATVAPDGHPVELGDAGKRAIAAMKAERDAARREAKANADAAKRLADFEESQKTEAQKIADRAAAAERERDDARAEGLRYKAAAKFGIDEDHFDLLGTGDEDAIAGRAERLGALLKLRTENDDLKAQLEALQQGKPSSGRPVPNLKPGATPEQNDPEETEYAQYAARFGR
ncbi:hypothetical protein JGU71_28230 [Antrihabitans sp. YC3-6]|uniref:DUF4355 domain-containing protein n=1 Tax=Antrihabitans stalagmiti TaxID=2799499 RepID=A0A934NWY7_9NOCA|nr:hypothetical protein [Antrihabitans stalagmiti]MBJ8342784.1 hypothetical protein [Antrihabitans stalagmiti]